MREQTDVALHYTMATAGGILGVYALLVRGGTFGSAQTANLLELFIDGLSGEVTDFCLRLGALALYGASLVGAQVLSRRLESGAQMRRVCILLETVCIVVAVLLPEGTNDLVALYPIFFATAFQWSVFCGAKGYNSSSIFSTNNLKQAVTAWTDYCLTRERKHRDKALFYTGTLAFFHLGVVLGFFAVQLWGAWGALLCVAPLAGALALSEWTEGRQATGHTGNLPQRMGQTR